MNKTVQFICSLLLLTANCTLPAATAQVWNNPMHPVNPNIGTGGDIGLYSKLLVVNGKPAMVCFDNTHDNLLYVRASDAGGSSWGTPVTIDATGTVGYYSSLCIVNGNPAISYYDATNTDLKYVRATDASGSTWGTSVIKTGMFDIPAGTKLYLHDKWLNKKEELKGGFEYWFDVTADTLSQGNNRFEINMVGQPTNGIAIAESKIAKMQLVPNPARDEVKYHSTSWRAWHNLR